MTASTIKKAANSKVKNVGPGENIYKKSRQSGLSSGYTYFKMHINIKTFKRGTENRGNATIPL